MTKTMIKTMTKKMTKTTAKTTAKTMVRTTAKTMRFIFTAFSIWILFFVLVPLGYAQTESEIEPLEDSFNTEEEGEREGEGVTLRRLAQIQGVRTNQLLGYGLVVGLSGTGDTRSKFASRSIRNLLSGLGQKADKSRISETRNIAAVLVTAEAPSFAKSGSRLSAAVSSVGDARSLEGGILIQTPLYAGNKQIYAVAQGAVSTGRKNEKTVSYRRGGKTVGNLLDGVIIEKELKGDIFSSANSRRVRVSLRRFDFSTLNSMRQGLAENFPEAKIHLDGGAVLVDIPSSAEPIAFIAKMEGIRIKPRYPSRVVVSEQSGAIVMGGDAQVDPVTISLSGMEFSIDAGGRQKNGLSKDVLEKNDIEKDALAGIELDSKNNRQKGKYIIQEFAGGSVIELVRSLHDTGAGIREITSILELLKDSGTLHAELIIK